MDKRYLLNDLCCWFNYPLEIKENGEVKITYSSDYYQPRADINCALIGFLFDLNDANEGLPQEDLMYQEEIKFITKLKDEVEQCVEILKSNKELVENIEICIGDLNKLEIKNTVSIEYDGGNNEHFYDNRYCSDFYTDKLTTLTFDDLLDFSLVEGKHRIEDMEKDDPTEWTGKIEKSMLFLEEHRNYPIVFNALQFVKDWLRDYGYEILDMEQNGIHIKLRVEDTQVDEFDEDRFRIESLAFWCKYFLEEIECKNDDYFDKDKEALEKYLNLLLNVELDLLDKEDKIKCTCDHCDKEIELLNEYDLQECPLCGEYTLPPCEDKIVITQICPVFQVNEIDDGYDFLLSFGYNNGSEIDDYLIDNSQSTHFIAWFIKKENNVFSFDDTSQLVISYHGENSEHYPFTDEQIAKIKNEISYYIKDRNLGEIKNNEEVVRMSKQLNVSGIAIGFIKNERFYDEVKWEEFDSSVYKRITDKITEDLNVFVAIMDCHRGIIKELSHETLAFIRQCVNAELHLSGYYFDSDLGMFKECKTVSHLSKLLLENNVLFSIRSIEELDLLNEEEFSKEYADVSYNKEITRGEDILISRNGRAYIVGIGITVDTDEELIDYIKSNMKNEEVVNMKNNLNLVYDKMDDEKYHVIKCESGIMFKGSIFDMELTLQADELHCKRDLDNDVNIDFVKSGKEVLSIDIVLDWLGVEKDTLFKSLEELVPKKEIPTNYIEINNEYYEINDLKDFLELKDELSDDELDVDISNISYKVNDNLVSEAMRSYKGYCIDEAIEEVETSIEFCDNNLDLFKDICSDYDMTSINSDDLWIAFGDIDDVAREYIEDRYDFDSDLRDYINFYEMFQMEVTYKEYHGCVVVEI